MKPQKYILFALWLFLFDNSTSAQFWLSSQRLTWDSINSERPIITLGSGSDIHVAWFGQLSLNNEVYYKKSSNSGFTWSAPKKLTWSYHNFSKGGICVDILNRVFIAFSDTVIGSSDVFYKKSEDGGATWQTLKRLTWTAGKNANVSVASDSPGNTYIVYDDNSPGNYEIYLKKSTSGGASWLPPQRLTWTSGHSRYPVIKTSTATTLHVAWCESFTVSQDVFYRSSIDGGITWAPRRRLTWNASEPANPNITIDSNGHIYIVWYDYSTTNIDIFLKKSTDGGLTWSALKRLTWNTGSSQLPVIDTSSTNVIHIAWHDNILGNREIFYKKSTDGGITWLPNNRVTWSVTNSLEPSIAAVASTNQIHLVWQENLSPDSEIFYKKNQLVVMKDKD